MGLKCTHERFIMSILFFFLPLITELCAKTDLTLPMRNMSYKENTPNLYMTKLYQPLINWR